MDEELTIRDLYEVLRRYRTLLIALPLAVAVLVFAVASFLPRTYAAEAVLTVGIAATAPTDSGNIFDFDPKLLPTPGALVSAYQSSAPARLAGSWQTDARSVLQDFEATQDDQSSALTLTAKAHSPQAALSRAQAAASDFKSYVNTVAASVLNTSLGTVQRRVQVQLSTDSELVRELQRLRAQTPPILPGVGQSTVRDQLEAAGVDPRYAGASDESANPAFTLLTVQVAQNQARVANDQATLARLKSLLADKPGQLALAGQLVQVNLLGAPSLPLKAQGLGPATLAVLAYLLALVATVLWALLHHAVRGPEPRAQGRRAVVTGD